MQISATLPWYEVYAGVGHQGGDVSVPGLVGGAEMAGEVEQQLPAQHLVACRQTSGFVAATVLPTVHVCDQFDLRHGELVAAGDAGELQRVERHPQHRALRQRVEPADVRALVVNLQENRVMTSYWVVRWNELTTAVEPSAVCRP